MFTHRILLLLICSTLLYACKTDDKSSEEHEQAYQDYKAFVAEVERDTIVTESDLGEAWKSRTDSLQQLSERHRKGITSHLEGYDAERREEVNAFDERLQVAFEERQRNYDEVSYRYKLRREMLNMDVSEDDMSNIKADNIAATYEHFVSTLNNKLPDFNARDWELVEGWWNALDNRRQELSNEISPSDQERIARQRETYLQVREKAFAESPATAAA